MAYLALKTSNVFDGGMSCQVEVGEGGLPAYLRIMKSMGVPYPYFEKKVTSYVNIGQHPIPVMQMVYVYT